MEKRINNAFFMRPWAIKKDIFDVMNEVFERFNRGEKLTTEDIQLRTADKKKTSPDYEIIGETAFVPIYGIIAKRANMVNGISMPSGTSIEEIRKDFISSLANDNVKKIVLDIDSPGGSVDGVGELAELIYNARGKKLIVAYVDGMMASAAYWIGSAADKVFASRTSEVGSIGVYATVYDYSVANHNRGIKTEIIKAGRNKAAGHPEKALTDEDRAVIQEEINDIYGLFIEAVGRHRKMSAEQSLTVATGRTYIASKALNFGLIDAIQNIDFEKDQAGQIAANKSAGKHAGGFDIDPQGGTDKKLKQEAVDMDPVKALTVDTLKEQRPDLFDAVYAQGKTAGAAEGKSSGEKDGHAKGLAQGKTEGKAEGVKEERARVVEIMESAKAIPDCEALAEKAINDGTSADESLKQFKAGRLNKLKTKAPDNPGQSVDEGDDQENQDVSIEEKCKQDWKANPNLHKEYASLESYTGWKRAKAKGRVTINARERDK